MRSVRPIDGGSVRETSFASSCGETFPKGRNFTKGWNTNFGSAWHPTAAGRTAQSPRCLCGRRGPEYPQATGDGRP
jgi:hypothetical protein